MLGLAGRARVFRWRPASSTFEACRFTPSREPSWEVPPAERGMIRPFGVSGNLEGRGPVDVIFSACLLAIHELNYPRPVPEVG